MTRLEPVHPGEVLKYDFMEPFALSAATLAKAIGVTPARINEIVRGRRGITAGTALRLAQYFSTDARSWMNLQVRYEVAARSEADALRVIRPCEEDRNDPLTKDFNETLAAHALPATEKNGRRTPASRTRQKSRTRARAGPSSNGPEQR